MEYVQPSEFEDRTVEQLRLRVEFMCEKITPNEDYVLKINGVSMDVNKVEQLEAVLPARLGFDACASDSDTSLTLGYDPLKQQLFLQEMEIVAATGHRLVVARLGSATYIVYPSKQSSWDPSDRVSRYMSVDAGDTILEALDIDRVPDLTNEHTYSLWLSGMLDRASRTWSIEETMRLDEGLIDDKTSYTLGIERSRGHGRARYSISGLTYAIRHHATEENPNSARNEVSYVFANEANNDASHALIVHANTTYDQFDEETDITPAHLLPRPLHTADDIGDMTYHLEHAEAAFNRLRKVAR